MGDPVRMTSVVHVCHDCRAGLEELGAGVVDGESLIALGHACETCAPAGLRLQASHAMRVAPSVLRGWRETVARRAFDRAVTDALPEGAHFVDVAHLAARLLGASGGASDADLIAAVGTARRLLQLAKGGGA